MGKAFGNLYKIHGVVYYRLSPHEQRAFKGVISDGVPNMIRRVREVIFRVAPPFVGTYLLLTWAEQENKKLHRKNPKDYENDV